MLRKFKITAFTCLLLVLFFSSIQSNDNQSLASHVTMYKVGLKILFINYYLKIYKQIYIYIYTLFVLFRLRNYCMLKFLYKVWTVLWPSKTLDSEHLSVLQFSNELLNLNEGFVLTHFNHVDNLKRNQKWSGFDPDSIPSFSPYISILRYRKMDVCIKCLTAFWFFLNLIKRKMSGHLNSSRLFMQFSPIRNCA